MFPGKDILRLEEKKNPAASPARFLFWAANIKKNFGVGEQNKEQRVSDIWLLGAGPLVAPSTRSPLLFCSVTLDHLPCSARWFAAKPPPPEDIPPPPPRMCVSLQ